MENQKNTAFEISEKETKNVFFTSLGSFPADTMY